MLIDFRNPRNHGLPLEICRYASEPRDWVPGELVTSAHMNTEIRDKFDEIEAGTAAVLKATLVGDTTANLAANLESGPYEAALAYDMTLNAIVASRDGGPFEPLDGQPKVQTTSATGAQNNFDLDARFTYLRCTGAAPVFSGFTVNGVAPQAGDRVIIDNCGTSTETTKATHEGAGSTEAHRILCPSAAGQIVGIKGRMDLVYDGTTERWREALVDAGAPIVWTPVDSSGAALTFTNVSGSYQQLGRQVQVRCDLRYPSTANGSPSLIGGLPFTVASSGAFAAGATACSIPIYFWGTSTNISPIKQAGGASLTNAELTLCFVSCFGGYFIA